MYITIALIAGAVIASPFVMYQVWKFIAPGLYTNEKRMAIPFVLFTTVGFVLGAAFNHYIAFPFMMAFFASFNGLDLAFMPRLEDMFGLYVKMLLGMGIVFQMPTIVFFLAKMRTGDREVPVAPRQVRDSARLHHRGGDHADRRSDEPDNLRGTDDRALFPEHHHRVDGESA